MQDHSIALSLNWYRPTGTFIGEQKGNKSTSYVHLQECPFLVWAIA